ncbi:TPA: DUF1795 domain-containing protein [Escherichia coli]|nr:DUF1795 domain-containing protein [Escherichia coli]HEI3598304.1 DUF1795 domain-containing protein [Escherichia coli]
MSESERCVFSEGSVSLPAGYNERTVNVLVAGDEYSPSLTISRDNARHGELLPDYIARQLAVLSGNLKGWVLNRREPVSLGNGQWAGERVDASYLRDGQRIWQQQAVFMLQDSRILVFTLTHNRKLSQQDTTLLRQVLDSYQSA